MKGVILKHRLQSHNEEEQYGIATSSVVSNHLLASQSKVVKFAMLVDMIVYTLEIAAVGLLWAMAIGYKKTNIQTVSALWFAAVLIDAIFLEVVFGYNCVALRSRYEDLARYPHAASKFLSICNISSLYVGPILRLAPAIGSMCLIVKYSPKLQEIVDSLHSSTAIFELYSSSHPNLKLPAGDLTWDVVSIYPLGVFSAGLLVLLCLCTCFYCVGSCCEIATRDPAPKENRKQHDFSTAVTAADNVKLQQPLSSDAENLIDFTKFNSLKDSLVQFGLPESFLPLENFHMVSKPLTMLQILTFYDTVFVIFVLVLRFTYKMDNVEFFHQLLWKLPVLYYVISIINFSGVSCICVLKFCSECSTADSSEENENLNSNTKELTNKIGNVMYVIRALICFVGSLEFMKNRTGNPLWAIQVFFCLLICEKIVLLLTNLCFGAILLVRPVSINLGNEREAQKYLMIAYVQALAAKTRQLLHMESEA